MRSGQLLKNATGSTGSRGSLERVHLMDAMPCILRAYYAFPESYLDREGHSCNAVVGFTNFLTNYFQRRKPTHMALCFDRGESTFRKESYRAYKSNRKLIPKELKQQIQRCRWFAEEGIGVPCYDIPGYEADDLIATLSKTMTECGHKCTVITNDKDLCQLVGKKVSIYDFVKREEIDESAVRKKLGVEPCQFVDLIGLMGDAVDRIPGVKGIGPKTAVPLLTHFKDLEELYDNLDRVDKLPIRGARGVQKRLDDGRDMAFRCRELARLERKVTQLEDVGLSNLKLTTTESEVYEYWRSFDLSISCHTEESTKRASL